MSGQRQIAIVLLIAAFVGGVFFVDKFVRPEPGNTEEEGDTETIRGIVTALLPSGKVVAVTTKDGKEALLSLTEASTLTNELGEELFYSDIKLGMLISAAGIRTSGEVVLPSLITVQSAYAYKGTVVSRIPSIAPKYFSLRYRESSWMVRNESELSHLTAKGCVLLISKTPKISGDWTKSVTERRLGGNIFEDARYTLKGEQKLRVVTLEDPGEKYGVSGDTGVIGPYVFAVTYESELSQSALTECMRDVDTVVSSFSLRNASQNILLLRPQNPIVVRAGEPFAIEGRARSFDGSVYVSIIDELGRKIVSKRLPVKMKEGEQYGTFSSEVTVPRSAPTKLKLRVFQYSPASGAPVDVVELPLADQ